GIRDRNVTGVQTCALPISGTLVLIFVAFSIASPEIFPTWGNMVTILYSTVVIGLLALGATFVITTAGIDLSVGTAMALCAVMSRSEERRVGKGCRAGGGAG